MYYTYTDNCFVKDMTQPLSFHASWTEMQPQLFHISTAADSEMLLSTAVPMVRALPRRGAAMFTRSTPGCGTFTAPASRGRPLCGKKTEKIQRKSRSEASKRGWATKRARTGK